jgi:hypothetical protein
MITNSLDESLAPVFKLLQKAQLGDSNGAKAYQAEKALIDAKITIIDLINQAEIRGASKAAEVINKEIGVEMTLNGRYYVNNMRLSTKAKELE